MTSTVRLISAGVGGLFGLAGLLLGIDTLYDALTKYDEDGYDAEGFNRDGYDREGFDRQGWDRDGFSTSGFDRDGFNRQGFDADGFDREGYDAEGFDRSGRDKRGYDRRGFDAEGFDRYGLDAEGYRRNGFGLDGYNREGFDSCGFGPDRYDARGLDRAGHCRQYYSDRFAALSDRLEEAWGRLKQKEYRYAIYDARVVLEDALRLRVQHELGVRDNDDRILANLKTCEQRKLLGDEAFLDRLHGVRKICNANGHELDAEDSMTHNKVHFVLKQVEELLQAAEKELIYVTPGVIAGERVG